MRWSRIVGSKNEKNLITSILRNRQVFSRRGTSLVVLLPEDWFFMEPEPLVAAATVADTLLYVLGPLFLRPEDPKTRFRATLSFFMVCPFCVILEGFDIALLSVLGGGMSTNPLPFSSRLNKVWQKKEFIFPASEECSNYSDSIR